MFIGLFFMCSATWANDTVIKIISLSISAALWNFAAFALADKIFNKKELN